jgi:hypothetical protein
MEKVNQYRVVKDYYDPEDKKTWDVKEWHDHEVFDEFQDAWAKMKRLKESGVLSFTDRWWIERKGYSGIFQLPEPCWTRALPWRVEWL